MTGKLTVSEGVISATLVDRGHMDAAKLDNRAAFELAVTEAIVNIGPNSTFASNLTLSVDLTPESMRALGLLLLTKSGAPAFTEPEWLRIRDACDLADAGDLAERIKDAYGA